MNIGTRYLCGIPLQDLSYGARPVETLRATLEGNSVAKTGCTLESADYLYASSNRTSLQNFDCSLQDFDCGCVCDATPLLIVFGVTRWLERFQGTCARHYNIYNCCGNLDQTWTGISRTKA